MTGLPLSLQAVNYKVVDTLPRCLKTSSLSGDGAVFRANKQFTHKDQTKTSIKFSAVGGLCETVRIFLALLDVGKNY